jgi:hypothetical protein
MARLSGVDSFAFGGIGFAASISDGEQDYRSILSRPTAEKDFERLFQAGNLPAKCYALVGLHELNGKRYATLASRLPKDKDVETFRGCIRFHRPIREMLSEIEAGVYSRGLVPQR